jgi:hypothetical protein
MAMSLKTRINSLRRRIKELEDSLDNAKELPPTIRAFTSQKLDELLRAARERLQALERGPKE